MDMKRPLMPGFLKKAEQKLLLNKPGLWSTRIHLVLYYGILFMVALAIVAFLDPMDLRRRSMEEVWIGYVSIISVIALVVWLIYFLRFNVFKKYGIIHPLYSLVNFVLIFIATIIIALFTQVQPAVESVRANFAYGAEEIVQDINAMNLKLCQLENAVLHEPWEKDTVLVVADSIADERESLRRVLVPPYNDEIYRTPYEILGETAMGYRRQSSDSIITINDSMYVIYETPRFAFIDEYDADDYTALKVLSSFEVYHQAVKPAPPANRDVIAKELNQLIEKYTVAEDTLTIFYNELIERDDSEFIVIQKKYRLSNVNRSIYGLVDKKYRWTPDKLPVYVYVFYYIGLGISVLIFMFRHSTIKTFFLSLLVGVLLTIFSSLFLAYSGGNETSFYMVLIIYTLLFFVGSLSSWMTKTRNVIAGIATNLFVLLVPIFPLVVAAWYYEVKTRIADEDPAIPSYTAPDYYWFIAQWSGAVLFLILLATYIHRVYRRWYSLPEE